MVSQLKVMFLNRCKEEKCEENQAIFRNVSCRVLSQFYSNLVCKVVYILEGIKHVNLIEIGLVVMEICMMG